MKKGLNGVTAKTPERILFGAGTIHKGLTYGAEGWNFEESIIGATKGGSKFEVKPEITNVELDGVYVKTKGTNVKTGETATMEINLAELTKDVILSSTIGKDGESDAANYDLIESKADIEAGDYWPNIAFVGRTLDDKDVIVIMPNALCTSGLSADGKNKENTVCALTFECNAELNDDCDTLPWKIYYPQTA